MYNYYRDNAQTLPAQNQFNPMAVSPVQTGYNPMAAMPVQNAFNPMAVSPVQNGYNQMGVMPMQNVMPMQPQYNPMAAMPTEELENMYPKTYNIIQPAVENTCDKMMCKYGDTYTPSADDVESMVEEVFKKVEPEVEAAIKNSPVAEERQFFGGGRRILRDFIGALLVGSLIRRRRRPFFGYPYFYGGFSPYFY